jgi:hypothetical protein
MASPTRRRGCLPIPYSPTGIRNTHLPYKKRIIIPSLQEEENVTSSPSSYRNMDI